MKNSLHLLWVLGSFCLFSACGPKILVSISESAVASLDDTEKIYVIHSEELLPLTTRYLGELKSRNSGFGNDCGYEEVLAKAKEVARSKGANIIALSSVKTPNLRSACYKISGRLLYADDEAQLQLLDDQLAERNKLSAAQLDPEYALINFYRPAYYPGSFINYLISDEAGQVIGKLKNNSAFRHTTSKNGLLTFQAGAGETISIQVQPGQVYYLRCGTKPGFPKAKPELYLVDVALGKEELAEM